jgi:DNA-directed primase/polymerase protein
VIEAGRPCKLYFDLEFSIPANPTLNGLTLVDQLLDQVIAQLRATWPDHVTTKDDILLLDSTSAVKFSIHVLFPTIVFVNNQIMGDWVRDFYDNKLTPGERNSMTVKKVVSDMNEDDLATSTTTSCSLIDFGVYTKNRNFRLYLSTKFGKATRLELAETDLFSVRLLEQHGGSQNYDLRRNIFLASLITWVNEALSPLDWPADCQIADVSSKMTENPTRRVKSAIAERSLTSSSSPYPEIDAFVKQIVDPGFIRKCIFQEVVVYIFLNLKHSEV